jgi:hypothetical protein
VISPAPIQKVKRPFWYHFDLWRNQCWMAEITGFWGDCDGRICWVEQLSLHTLDREKSYLVHLLLYVLSNLKMVPIFKRINPPSFFRKQLYFFVTLIYWSWSLPLGYCRFFGSQSWPCLIVLNVIGILTIMIWNKFTHIFNDLWSSIHKHREEDVDLL